MPTSKGFTGQRADSGSSGLDYYGARYYDPVLGQFASADTAQDGLNRYGYVHGNPTTATDPTGHRAGGCIIEDGQYICPPQPPAPPTTKPPCTHDCGGCTHNCGGGDGKVVSRDGAGASKCDANDALCQDCQTESNIQVCEAKELAGQASKTFGLIALALGLLAGVLTVAIGALQPELFFNPIVDFILSALYTAAAMAGALSYEFGSEGSNGAGWFTRDGGYEDFKVKEIGGVFLVGTLLAGLAQAFFTFIFKVVPAVATAIVGGILVASLISDLAFGKMAIDNLSAQDRALGLQPDEPFTEGGRTVS